MEGTQSERDWIKSDRLSKDILDDLDCVSSSLMDRHPEKIIMISTPIGDDVVSNYTRLMAPVFNDIEKLDWDRVDRLRGFKRTPYLMDIILMGDSLIKRSYLLNLRIVLMLSWLVVRID